MQCGSYGGKKKKKMKHIERKEKKKKTSLKQQKYNDVRYLEKETKNTSKNSDPTSNMITCFSAFFFVYTNVKNRSAHTKKKIIVGICKQRYGLSRHSLRCFLFLFSPLHMKQLPFSSLLSR